MNENLGIGILSQHLLLDKILEKVEEKTKKKMSRREFFKYKKMALKQYENFPKHLRLPIAERMLKREEILEEIEKESKIGKLIIEMVRMSDILEKEMKKEFKVVE
jgi:hypothetical protein